MEKLSVSIIQSTLIWENAEANREMFSEKIEAIQENTKLIVLPEMFSTGFSMQAEQLSEPPEGKTLRWMQHTAQQKKICHYRKCDCQRKRKLLQSLIFCVS